MPHGHGRYLELVMPEREPWPVREARVAQLERIDRLLLHVEKHNLQCGSRATFASCGCRSAERLAVVIGAVLDWPASSVARARGSQLHSALLDAQEQYVRIPIFVDGTIESDAEAVSGSAYPVLAARSDRSVHQAQQESA